MTAFELRRHLAAEHDVRILGADYGTLIAVHDVEHRTDVGHVHDDQAGQGQVQGFLWTLALILAIILMLHALGVHL